MFVALTALASMVLRPAFNILPFDGDNFYALLWSDRTTLSEVYRVDPAIYPEWRPLAYLSVWGQYRLTGLDTMVPYFVVNLLLLVACAWLVHDIVLRWTASPVGAWSAASLAMTDQRVVSAMTWIIERQSSMACLLGLAACRWAADPRRAGRSPVALVGLVALLVLAPLSKEYGVAFAVGFVAYGWAMGRRDLIVPGGVAVALYTVLRLMLVSGATRQYCETMGYFFESRVVCLAGPAPGILGQLVYNVAATLIGSIVPGLFTADGVIAVSGFRLSVGVFSATLAVIGWWRGPHPVRLSLAVLIAVSLLSVMLYRDRNQFLSVFVVAIALGSGVSWVCHTVPWMKPALVGALALVLAGQSVRTYRFVEAESIALMRADPCESGNGSQRDLDFAIRLKQHLGMSNATCAP